MNVIRTLPFVLSAILCAACSGGGGVVSASHAPAPQTSTAPTKSTQAVSGTLVLAIPIPSKAASPKTRRPKFVSPSTATVSITVDEGIPVNAAVGPTSPLCTTSGTTRTCSIPIGAPPGATTIVVGLYDSNTYQSNSGTLLGTGSGTTTATLGQNFSLAIVINPVAGSIASPTLAYSPGTSLSIGTAGTASFTPVYSDPDGNAIPTSATFSSPLTLSTTDTNVTVSPSSVTNASQAITLSYNGSTAVGGSFTLLLTTGTGTSVTTAGTVTLEPGYAPPVSVSTFAGTGTPGFTNGPGAGAAFNGPEDVAVDAFGNLYVSDRYNSVIREISAAGVVSTLAGTGTQGFTNGPDASATFYFPEGDAIDSAGNVYVADTFNEAIRKITVAGTVSTFAGGSYGFSNGSGTSATFYNPDGMAVDNTGNVYVVDAGNNAIRKISPAGIVSTYAGTGTLGFTNGPAASASFGNPYGVTVDSSGNVYVGDGENNAIRKISVAGIVSTFAGTGVQGFTNGPVATATFYDPSGVAVDGAGNVYVADGGNSAIRKITPAGVVSTLAGTGVQGYTDGPAASATFSSGGGLAVDAAGNVYVADFGNDVIRKITP